MTQVSGYCWLAATKLKYFLGRRWMLLLTADSWHDLILTARHSEEIYSRLSWKMKFLHSGHSHSDASGRVWMLAVSADAMHFISLWCWHRDSDVISEGVLKLFPKKVTDKSSACESQSTPSLDDANLLFFLLICLQ